MKCRMCNNEFHKGGIANHVKYYHQLSFRDYIKKFIKIHPEDFPYWRLRNENKLVRISTQGKKKLMGEYNLPDNNIKCLICENKLGTKGIGFHVQSVHGIEYKDYVKKFIDDFPDLFPNWHKCRICKKIVKGHKTCSMKCSNEYRKTLVGEKAVRFGVKLTKEVKNKIRNTHKKKIEEKGHWRIGLKNTLDARANMRESALKRARQPDYVNPMQGKTHTPETIKKIFSHKEMNSVEKMVAEELAKNNIEYYFQYFLTRDGICKSFDFKIKNKKLFIEVDGDYWHGGPGSVGNYFKGVNEVKENDKFKEQLAKENGFEVIRIWESEIKKDKEIIMGRVNDKIEINIRK